MRLRRSAALLATALLFVFLAACGAGREPGGAEARKPAAPYSAPAGATGTPPPPPPVTTPPAPAPAVPRTPPSADAEPSAVAGPDLSRTTAPPAPPSGEAAGTGGRATVTPKSPSAPSSAPPSAATRSTATTLRIGAWSARVVRGGQEEVDACQDAVQWAGPNFGAENGYKMRTIVVVGHDHCGFQQFATLPTGTVVTVDTPRETLTYKVYARYLTPGRGAPAHGLYWGDLTLQSCVGPDTGFTYLTRV
ncbi:hypothetical protein [Streptomyces sp. NPDC002913]